MLVPILQMGNQQSTGKPLVQAMRLVHGQVWTDSRSPASWALPCLPLLGHAWVPVFHRLPLMWPQRCYPSPTWDCPHFGEANSLPLSLQIERQLFEETVKTLNGFYAEAEKIGGSSYLEGCLACATAYFIFLCMETHYEKVVLPHLPSPLASLPQTSLWTPVSAGSQEDFPLHPGAEREGLCSSRAPAHGSCGTWDEGCILPGSSV